MALVCVRLFRLFVALSVQMNIAKGPLQIFVLLQQPLFYITAITHRANESASEEALTENML